MIAALTAWSAEPARAPVDATAAENAASNSVEFLEAPGAEDESLPQPAFIVLADAKTNEIVELRTFAGKS